MMMTIDPCGILFVKTMKLFPLGPKDIVERMTKEWIKQNLINLPSLEVGSNWPMVVSQG
jgi:hypothetical protein